MLISRRFPFHRHDVVFKSGFGFELSHLLHSFFMRADMRCGTGRSGWAVRAALLNQAVHLASPAAFLFGVLPRLPPFVRAFVLFGLTALLGAIDDHLPRLLHHGMRRWSAEVKECHHYDQHEGYGSGGDLESCLLVDRTGRQRRRRLRVRLPF